MWAARALSSSWSTEYWPFAVAAVLCVQLLEQPGQRRGQTAERSGVRDRRTALASGRAGPAPGVAVATAGGAQLM